MRKIIKICKWLKRGFLLIIISVKLYSSSFDTCLLKIRCDLGNPGNITDLQAKIGQNIGEVDLTWTVPGDDGTVGQLQAGAYIIKCDTQSIAEFDNTTYWWNYAEYTYFDNEWVPNVPGMKDTYTWGGLKPGVTYYFAIKVRDDAGNESEISNIASAPARWDWIAPSSITDLVAVTAKKEGEIKLFWTAPGDDGTVGQITNGKWRIRWSTYDVLNWESDWSNKILWNEWQNKYSLDISTSCLPFTEHTLLVTGLNPGVTYYFHIWVADEYPNWSKISNLTSAIAYKQKYLNPITDLITKADNSVDGKLDLEWTSVGGVSYVIKYDVKGIGELGGTPTSWWELASSTYPQTWQPKESGAREAIYGLAGLTAGDTYYIAVRAVDGYGNLSLMGNVCKGIAGDKIPDAPQGLNVELVGNKVKLSWSANTEPDIDEYIIYKKTWGEFEELVRVKHPSAEFYDEDIENNNKYTYRLQVVDNAGNFSEYSEEKIIVTGELLQYSDVDIIKITQISTNSLTFEWSQVDINTNQIKGYAIEKTDDLTSNWTEIGFVYSTETLKYIVPIQTDVYYRIVTVSWYDVKSKGLLAIDTSEDFNHIYSSEDRDAWVEIANSFASELYAENNGGAPVKIEFVKESNNGFLLSYNIKAVNGSSEKSDFMFMKTRLGAKICFDYNQIQTKGLSANQQLTLFRYNGVEWIKLGGIADGINGRVYTMSRQLGRYAVKFDTLATEFSLTKVVPRIFTPEESNSTINRVNFYFENPNFAEVTIRIFDITGALIKDNLPRRMGLNEIYWDGTDKNGKIVKGGIYIYQIEAEGKIINGTVIVAK